MELGTLDAFGIKQQLLQSDEEFRRLAQKHSSYDEQLAKLIHKAYLSDQEKVEEINLKKKKLQVKDQMELMIQKYRQQAGSQDGQAK